MPIHCHYKEVAKTIRPEKAEITVKDFIFEHLKNNFVGAEKAISGLRLSSIAGVTPSDVRRIVNTLRSEKHPICSDSNGYFYAASTKEIDMTIAHLTSRTRHINRAKEGLHCAKLVFDLSVDAKEVER